MAPRNKCVFNDQLKELYPFLETTDNQSEVRCTICNSSFSIANSGKSQIEQHLKSVRHTSHQLSKVKSKPVTTFFSKLIPTDKDLELAAKEGALAYHTVQHDHSFRSMDCTSKLIKELFESKFSNARTKAEAIVTSVIAPQVQLDLREELTSVNFVSVSVDCSNHGATKLFPVIVRYFHFTKGVQVKLLNITSLENETSDTLCEKLQETISASKLNNKIICLCADNTNTNFGGLKRKGKNNLHQKLQSQLKKPVIGIGCSAHILNNAIENAVNYLPFDVEAILFKIYKYFSIYTVRTEQLKRFCEFVDVEYKKVLSSSKTRWLSLAPALERVLQIFDPLKSYFLSQDNGVKFLKDFFVNPMNELWLWFIHCQAEVFHRVIAGIEASSVSVVEISQRIENLENILNTRKDENFIGLTAKSLLRKIINEGYEDESKFYSTVREFYTALLEYISEWKSPLSEIRHFHWVLLKNELSWTEIETSLAYIKKYSDTKIDDGMLIDEFALTKSYIDSDKIHEWKKKEIVTDQRWIDVFQHLEANDVKVENMKKIVEFALTLPGTSAAVERIFSTVNKYWSQDKSQLHVDTLRSVLYVKTNLNITCVEAYSWLKSRPKLLKAIHSSQKYT